MRNKIGLLLIGLYLMYQLLPEQPGFIDALQQIRGYKNWSGFALFLLVLAQWSVSVYRGIFNASGPNLEKAYQLHYWIGSLAPLVFFIHSPKPDYGMLLLLAILFFSNSLLGIVLQHPSVVQRGVIKQVGIGIHVLASTVILALILLHIWTVFSFN
jgi:cytochrome b561